MGEQQPLNLVQFHDYMRLYAGTTQGVFKVNADNGIVTRLGPLDTSVEKVAVQGDTILAAITPDYGTLMRGALHPSQGRGVMRSTDAGRHWVPCGGVLEDAQVTALAWGAGSFIAGTDPASILHSYDLGATWAEGTPLSGLPGASRWGFPRPPHTAHVMTIVPHPTHSMVLYAGIEVGGVVMSSDGGCNWHEIGATDPTATVHPAVHGLAVCPGAPHVVYAATPDGVFLSETAGATWVARSSTLDPLYCRPITVHQTDPDIAITVATPGASGFFGREAHRTGAKVMRTVDRGVNWLPVQGLPEHFQPTPALVADPLMPGRFFLPLFSGELYVSTDDGATWELLVEGIPTILGMIAA